MYPDLQADSPSQNHTRPEHGDRYKVGYYRPTYDFSQIQEFMAVLGPNEEMIALTGSSMSRDAALNARMFSLAPALQKQLQVIYDTLMKYPRFLSDTQTRQEALDGNETLASWLQDTERLLKTLDNCLL